MTHTEALSSLASERYLLDEMTETERDAFEAHYFDCQECADDVRSGALMSEGAQAGYVSAAPSKVATFSPSARRSGTAATPPPAVVRTAWYRSSALPWAVAATLAVVVGYQSQLPGPGRSGELAEAIPTITLRPASRGTAPSISLAPSHAALALDLDASGAGEVSYDLRAESGDIITSGRGAAPVAGAPFLLVIPTFTLKAQQQYILTVRDASDPQRVLSEYRFATAP